VTGAGGFLSPFFGTSASAPHAAAIAGLIKSSGLPLTNVQIRNVLTTSAIDIEAPGIDRDSGAGIVMAFEALQAAGAAPMANPILGPVIADDAPGDGDGAVEAGEGAALTVQLRNVGGLAATAISATLTSSTPFVIVTQPGSSAYPDLPASGGLGDNLVPFRFTLTSDAPCPLNASFSLTVSFSGGASPKVLPIFLTFGAQAPTITSTLDATPPLSGPGFNATTGISNTRLNRNGIASACVAPKAFPGLAGGAGDRRFDAYAFSTCAAGGPACVTVTLTNACAGANPSMFGMAYLNSFDSTNLETNYLADAGVSQIAAGPASFSFEVPAGASFVVVVHEVNAGLADGCQYSLSISGFCSVCDVPNQLPIAVCRNVTVPAGSNCAAEADINNGSSDPEGGPITVTQSPAGPYPLGTTTVTLTVTDNKGAQSQCTGTVTVTDSTPPLITCPVNSVVQLPPGSTSFVLNYPAPVATDNCPGTTVVCSPPSGAIVPAGTTTIVCVATDASGNTATCSFQITAFNIVARDDSSGVFVRFVLRSGGGATNWEFFDCSKNVALSGSGTVSVSFCKVILSAGNKSSNQSINLTVNPCQNSATGTIRIPARTYNLNDSNISNNGLFCP
jgi:hypothetical protein